MKIVDVKYNLKIVWIVVKILQDVNFKNIELINIIYKEIFNYKMNSITKTKSDKWKKCITDSCDKYINKTKKFEKCYACN